MNDIAMNNLSNRMNNDFYLGVVGSVRSGKSSFINTFFKLKVLPYIDDDFTKHKILDELPQCSDGKQIMTVEPKFIPANSLEIKVNEDTRMNVRLVDCVGSIIPSAIGYEGDDGPRLVKTPWFDEAIPFEEAARIGTEKVIYNHANLGIYVTSDGSFGDFKRYEYEAVEAKLIPILEELKKPYVIVLNVADPKSDSSQKLKEELSLKYNVGVVVVNILKMTEEDCDLILKEALKEFPIEELELLLPDYLEVIGDDVPIKKQIDDLLINIRGNYTKIKDVNNIVDSIKDANLFSNVEMTLFSPGEAKVSIKMEIASDKYEEIVNELLDNSINNRVEFLAYLYKCKKAIKVYDEIGESLLECKEKGYSVASPVKEEMKLLAPTILKQNGNYGVKLEAIAPSIHLIKVDVNSTFTPMVGSAKESENIIEGLVNKDNNDEVWNQEFFGRKLADILNDSMKNKVCGISDKSKDKIKNILNKVVNANNNGFIAIIL